MQDLPPLVLKVVRALGPVARHHRRCRCITFSRPFPVTRPTLSRMPLFPRFRNSGDVISEPVSGWSFHDFRGDRWCNIASAENRRCLRNAYRVLLTRARQGMIIFVPPGDPSDPTRLPRFYNPYFQPSYTARRSGAVNLPRCGFVPKSKTQIPEASAERSGKRSKLNQRSEMVSGSGTVST